MFIGHLVQKILKTNFLKKSRYNQYCEKIPLLTLSGETSFQSHLAQICEGTTLIQSILRKNPFTYIVRTNFVPIPPCIDLRGCVILYVYIRKYFNIQLVRKLSHICTSLGLLVSYFSNSLS